MNESILRKYLNNEKTSTVFRNYTLDGITAILDRLGNPHKSTKLIHVAGTNGKGSTCHMLSSIFESAGYTTGLYTSPHLEKITERIRINSIEIAESELEKIIEDIDRLASIEPKIILTYFDLLTAAAFCYFRNCKADVAIIETGLGGRLDTTNIISPIVSVITDISLDHCSILGNTIEEIALEKAGIIKNNTPIVTSNSDTKIYSILKKYADDKNAPLFAFGHDFFADNLCGDNEKISFDYRSDKISIGSIAVSHPGDFQAKNASCAIAASLLASSAGLPLSHEMIKKGIIKTTIPGRMEILMSNPTVIFDPAHNEQAILSLADMIQGFADGKGITVFVSIMKDKFPENLLKIIRNRISRDIIYCSLDDERAYIPLDISEFADKIDACNTTKIAKIIENRSANMILFTGSFRIYHPAKESVRLYKCST